MLFFVSTTFALRNYYGTLQDTSKKSEALNLCMNNLNEEKAKAYANIANSNGIKKVGNTDYTYKIVVSNYIKNGTEVVTGAKVIESIVTYELNDKTEEITERFVSTVKPEICEGYINLKSAKLLFDKEKFDKLIKEFIEFGKSIKMSPQKYK